MMKIGDKVVCNWGAMHPTEDATVIKIGIDGNTVIEFEDGTTMFVDAIKEGKIGAKDRTGSPIGIYAV